MNRSFQVAFTLTLLVGLGTACGGGKKDDSSTEEGAPLVVGDAAPVSGVQPGTSSSTSGGITPISTIPGTPTSPKVPQSPAPPIPSTPANHSNVYYASGFLVTSFADEIPLDEDFQGWNFAIAPARVQNTNILTTNYLMFKVERVAQ